MADNTPRLHLICYDITEPRRLARVHRYLVKRAVPLQYSVFLAHGSPRAVGALMAVIDTLIDEGSDDVRCYALPVRLEYVRLGRQMLPVGVTLAGVDLPSELLTPG